MMNDFVVRSSMTKSEGVSNKKLDEEKQLAVKIADDKAKELILAESSIQSWSIQYMELTLQLRGVESTVHNLYQHKASLMSEALKDAGIDLSKYARAQMGPDGTVFLDKIAHVVSILDNKESDPTG